VVRHAEQDITSLRFAPQFAPALALQEVRGWADGVISLRLCKSRHNLARALLLGEEGAMDQEDWDRFQRTGVVHVLAVSGQHLVVLAGFLAVLLRVLHMPRRRVAVVVPFVLLGYSLLTGWQPPVQRSFVMIGTYCGAVWLGRVVLSANVFGLAWLLVCLFDPSSIFYGGCQLSFLAAGILLWSNGLLPRRPTDPVEQLLDEQRPLWQRILRDFGRKLLALFVVSVWVWLTVAPLVAWHFHTVCPVALIIGIPVVFLTSIALITGFLMLLVAPLCAPAAIPFGWVTDGCLTGCDALLASAERWPLAYWYVPDLPLWWVVCFYVLLIGGLVLPRFRRRPLRVAMALLAWLGLGLAFPLLRPGDGQFRCTFLSVGHGSCVVLELPDGRTLLYDAGSLAGPDVTRRHIAPYLWHRGIRRIDEILLSHADLDHFNGLAALAERFVIGQVSCTPSFSERDVGGVRFTLSVLAGRAIPVRTIKAGDRLSAGAVDIQVLHPPPVGPPGKENHRSLVLLIRHLEHTILLTGDLEGPGQDRVLSLPPVPVDVMMAPHHGSPAANNSALAKWASARVVVSCQGLPRSPLPRPDPYTPQGAIYLTTWQDGAVAVESGPAGLLVQTFKGQQTWKLR
jgi:competence protein ComEC